ncbi:MAG TPA: hypothetical protein VLL76_07620 [Candidatus Omnitrophota bacterium]|nr:hypothetical protein [Candidatus Omnitrophota bacterium]
MQTGEPCYIKVMKTAAEAKTPPTVLSREQDASLRRSLDDAKAGRTIDAADVIRGRTAEMRA